MHPSDVLLTTERLVLRRFAEADLDHLYALDNDPEVMRWINGGTPTPREVIARDILPGFCRHDPAHPAFGFWAAIEKNSGAFVGWFCFRRADPSGETANLGYRLVRNTWGRGYATEGARALIRMGFEQLGVARVVASTYEYNAASRRVMVKLGMTLTRRFRLSAEEIAVSDTSHTEATEVWEGDEVEYALTAEMWARREGSAGSDRTDAISAQSPENETPR